MKLLIAPYNKKLLIIGAFFFSTANRPKTSRNLNLCWIKIAHSPTFIYMTMDLSDHCIQLRIFIIMNQLKGPKVDNLPTLKQMRTSNVCQRPFKAIKDHLKVFLTTLYSFFNATVERLMCLTDDPLSIVIYKSLEHLLFISLH